MRIPRSKIVSDMRTLALGRRFQAVLAWDSYFFLKHDDRRQMFDVSADHADAFAVLMFNTGPAYGEAIGNYQGEPLYHTSLDPVEYEALLDRHGFSVIAHAVEDPQAGGRTVWLAQRR